MSELSHPLTRQHIDRAISNPGWAIRNPGVFKEICELAKIGLEVPMKEFDGKPSGATLDILKAKETCSCIRYDEHHLYLKDGMVHCAGCDKVLSHERFPANGRRPQ